MEKKALIRVGRLSNHGIDKAHPPSEPAHEEKFSVCISFCCSYETELFWTILHGLAVLMASAVVVLKHETSTLRHSHNCISIDLIFGESDYVREVTSPAKFGSDPMSGRDATWGQHILVL